MRAASLPSPGCCARWRAFSRCKKRPRGAVGLGRMTPGGGEVADRLLGAERRALEGGGQEAGSPVVRAGLRHAARIGDGDERRQVLVLAAERVADPRADAREAVEREAGGQEVLGRAVRVALAGQRVDEAMSSVSSARCGIRSRDHLAGLAARAERVLRSGQVARRALERDGRPAGQRLAVALDQLRLVVPGVELADGAGAEDDDDVLRLRREVRRPRRERPGRIDDRRRRCAASRPSRPSRFASAIEPSAVALLGEKLPAIEQERRPAGERCSA